MPLQVPPPILGYRHHPLEYFLTYDGFMYSEPQVSFCNHISIAAFQTECLCQGHVTSVFCVCIAHVHVLIFKEGPCASTDPPHFNAEHSPYSAQGGFALFAQQSSAIKDMLCTSHHYFV